MTCKNILCYLFGLSVILLLVTCNPKMGEVVIQPPQLADKSGTISENERIAEGLDHLARSVYRMTVITFYEVFTFADGNRLEKSQLKDTVLRRIALNHNITNHTILGTAIPVYYDGENAGFITCAHVVAFPDTLITYYPAESRGRKKIVPIKSVAIKLRQKTYISALQGDDVTVVAADKEHDIAFLKLHIDPSGPRPVLFPFSPGNTTSLNWGTRLYILGFPQGRKMVTSALYSKSTSLKNGFFLMDAIFNRGFSGAPVVVSINKPPYFQWVGMASSVASSEFTYLEPILNEQNDYSRIEPFKGQMVVNKGRLLNYGITFSVTIEQIRKFVKENNYALNRASIGSMQW